MSQSLDPVTGGRKVVRAGNTVTVETWRGGQLHAPYGPAVVRVSPGAPPQWEQWVSGARDASGSGAAVWFRDDRVVFESAVDPTTGEWTAVWYDWCGDGDALPALAVRAGSTVEVVGGLPDV